MAKEKKKTKPKEDPLEIPIALGEGREQIPTNHINTAQFRQETWNLLKVTSADLFERSKENEPLDEPMAIIERCFQVLAPLERFWAYPGKSTLAQLREIFRRKDYFLFVRSVSYVVRTIISESYREVLAPFDFPISDVVQGSKRLRRAEGREHNPLYFEVMVVDNLAIEDEVRVRNQMRSNQDVGDKFIYDIIFAPSFEDALMAVLLNTNIQSVVIRYGFPVKSQLTADLVRPYLPAEEVKTFTRKLGVARGLKLGAYLHKIRPELDLYLVTDAGVEEASIEGGRHFRRIFYRNEDFLELHLSICKGIRDRYTTPFFNALTEFSQKPTGVFHAMPVSRGNSIYKTHWIRDMGTFYGKNIFLAETSATTGGLDSLLHPTGPLKAAQSLAARAFGSMYTYFVTNGTSTANKIVQQALLQPGDVVLIDRDCHKSHHYGIVLAGGHPVYLDSYPLESYSMYGAVPLKEIKRVLLRYKREGRLDRVKMLVLTNSTFDGLIYHPRRVMREILAIKPDMIFLWDEAWFGFAHFHPWYRRRSAMASAKALAKELRSDAYRKTFAEKGNVSLTQDNEEAWLDHPLYADPDEVRLRVYCTHSTHKTLSSLRQGSMIHIYDECFQTRSEHNFNEAYMTHTSTSPNYQILASLDVARRQAELEGYELIQKSIEMAMILRETVKTHPLLSRYFRFLSPADLIPDGYRPSGLERFFTKEKGYSSTETAWEQDEFVLDPTRITLYIGKTGIDGDTFRKEYLMDQFGIQVNKTTRNTVLFMTNIGSNRSATAFLISVLLKIAKKLKNLHFDLTPQKGAALAAKIRSLTVDLPALPHFSGFHEAFQTEPGSLSGDMRRAYYLSYNHENCSFVPLCENLIKQIEEGRQLVSASFVTPYPPGFPVLVPGQIISRDVLEFLLALDVKEIHGYNPELGLRIFNQEVLKPKTPASAEQRKYPTGPADDHVGISAGKNTDA